MSKLLLSVVLGLCLFVQPLRAEEEAKRYNFGVRPHPLAEEPAEAAKDAAPAEVKAEEKKEEPKQADTPPAAPARAPIAEAPKDASPVVNGVFSPKGKPAKPSHSAGRISAENSKKAEELVRFFIGSCLKYYGRDKDMVAYMDATFPRLETERKADFAPVIGGNINTQYWDVVRGDAFYMLAKDTSGGKCDLIAKDGASTAVHKELKAVMDGLTITKILQTQTEYEKVANKNKEVTMINILGHPLEKELAIVATTKIKDTGDNMAAILTLFTVPQETVEVKETAPVEEPATSAGFSKE